MRYQELEEATLKEVRLQLGQRSIDLTQFEGMYNTARADWSVIKDYSREELLLPNERSQHASPVVFWFYCHNTNGVERGVMRIKGKFECPDADAIVNEFLGNTSVGRSEVLRVIRDGSISEPYPTVTCYFSDGSHAKIHFDIDGKTGFITEFPVDVDVNRLYKKGQVRWEVAAIEKQ